LEGVIMLVAIIDSAQWIIRRLEVPQRFGTTMGLIPIGLLLPGEIAGILWVLGRTLREYLVGFLTAPGIVSLLMFLVSGAMRRAGTPPQRRASSVPQTPIL
jgi:hypothetical protein